MRCKTCDYPLWSLRARECPECGTPFRPDEFEFVPNSVRFCCPHCEQSYYGTGPRGELVPASFACVACGRALEMNACVLRPADGVREEETSPTPLPWTERRTLGRWRAWTAMIGMALVRPATLMRGVAIGSPTGQAWWFATVTQVLIMIVSVVPLMLLMFLPLGVMRGTPGGPTGPTIVGIMAGAVVGGTLVSIVATMLSVVLWGLVTHAALRLTGPTTAGLGRTYQALCYSSGANIVSAVPCVGQYLGWIWWVVSAVLMIREGQNTTGWRASLAVLLFPVITTIAAVGLYALLIFSAMSTAGQARAAAASAVGAGRAAEAAIVGSAVRSYADTHGGAGPAHGLLLVATGDLAPGSFLASGSGTTMDDVTFGSVALADTLTMGPGRIEQVARTEVERQGDVPAHRVGDVVFTCAGIDFTLPDREPEAGGLWVVVLDPAGDVGDRHVARLDGVVRSVAPGDFDDELAAQNALRETWSLPPLSFDG